MEEESDFEVSTTNTSFVRLENDKEDTAINSSLSQNQINLLR